MRRTCLALLALFALPASAQAGTLLSVRADGGGKTVLARDAKAYFYTPCQRADGTVVGLAERRNRQWLLVRPGGKPRWSNPKGDGELLYADFAPGCERVAESYYAFPTPGEQDDGTLIRDAAGKEVRRFKGGDPGDPPTLVWSPDGTRVALMGWERNEETIRIIDAATGRTISRRTTRHAELGPQAFSPDGSALVYTDSSRLLVLETATGKARALAGGKDGRELRSPAWSPAGDRIAAVNMGGGIELLDPKLGYGPTIPSPDLYTEQFVWSPDGSSLALYYSHDDAKAGQIKWGLAVIGATVDAKPRVLVKPNTNLTVPVWTPDGTALLVGS